MPVRMQRNEVEADHLEEGQVCARGWQDYMIETKLFELETAVAECLKDLAPALRAHLGLDDHEIKQAA